jgi:putative endonuclease
VVLATNWRSRTGEIDLIVGRDRLVVVCEVKTRSSDRFGTAAEAVGPRKQARLRRLAVEYLAARRSAEGGGGWDLRFDVATVAPGPHGFAVEVIEAAF